VRPGTVKSSRNADFATATARSGALNLDALPACPFFIGHAVIFFTF
jgi:hypothetical protein